MLCEVETAILNLGLQLPKTHRSVLVTESPNWAREGDLTLMLIQDSGVLRLYQTFLNDWMRALRNATATGPGTCDPSKLRPLASYFKSKKFQKKQRVKENRKKIKRVKNKLQNSQKKKLFPQGRRKLGKKKIAIKRLKKKL